jgi:hypothetical protein
MLYRSTDRLCRRGAAVEPPWDGSAFCASESGACFGRLDLTELLAQQFLDASPPVFRI